MDIFKTLLVSTPGAVGSSVAITGGSINGTNIGATTPGSGAFTTLTASGATTLTATTASTSTTTGALIVSGGVGVAKAILGGDILGACGDDKAFLSWNGSVDTYYVSANYANANGTESVTNSSRGSWRTGMRVATSPRVSWGWRAGSAGAGTFTELMYLTSAGDVSIAGTTASTSTTTGALVVSGGIGAAGAANVGTYYGMVDGVTAPGATVGYAKIYVDTADGDLKVIFGDGTIKTLTTDT